MIAHIFTKTTLIVAFLTMALPCSSASALTEPRGGSADARIKTVTYRDNDVFQLRGHYGFTTMVELSPKEAIETTSIGDSEAWQVIPSAHRGNILFLKPLEPNAETNMTVLTDQRIYAFELSADTASSYKSDDLAFRVKFLYAEDAKKPEKFKKYAIEDYDPLQESSDSAWNFNYAYAGARRLRPEKAFDDGTFTYLKFLRQDVAPAVFSVDETGKESLVNFNIQGQYIVIERISRQFTLRDGDTAICIFNEGYEIEAGIETKKTSIKSSLNKKLAKNDAPTPSKKPAHAGSTAGDPPVTAEQQKLTLWQSLGARDANSSASGFNQ
ncbi:MAG: P-type conjugative transfer protein VirB9 [Alphaproteobacteria bacterium]|nr:P-type conjugative transfer protein VirB9 [Alphaproteobacteria bacterium]